MTKAMQRDFSVLDPEGLILANDSDFGGLPGEKDWAETWDGAVAACRAWYDANNHGKAFCC